MMKRFVLATTLLLSLLLVATAHAFLLIGPTAPPGPPTITSLQLDGGTTETYVSGTTYDWLLGVANVTMSDGSYFTGTVAADNSTSGQHFAFGGLTLGASINNSPQYTAPTCTTNTAYTFNITATPGVGEGGSPVTRSVTVNCIPTGPAFTYLLLNLGTSGQFTSGIANTTIGNIKPRISDSSAYSGTMTVNNTGFTVANTADGYRLMTSGTPPTCTVPTRLVVNVTAPTTAGMTGPNKVIPVHLTCEPSTTINVVQTQIGWGNTGNNLTGNTVNVPLNQPFTTGDAVIGYIHSTDQNDANPTWPNSVTDDAGDTYSLTPFAQWQPFPENVGIFYIPSVAGTVHTLYFAYGTQSQVAASNMDFSATEYTPGGGTITTVGGTQSTGTASPSIQITTAAPSRIFTAAAIDQGVPSDFTNPGFSMIADNLVGVELGGWNSDQMVAAGTTNLTFSSPTWNNNAACASFGTGCMTVMAAAAISAPAAPVITGAQVAGTTSPSYVTGSTSVGAITIQESNGTFTGTLALGGTNASSFSLSSTSLPANLNIASGAQTCASPTTYNITITPTQAGISGSGTAYPITITCNSSLPAATLVNSASPAQCNVSSSGSATCQSNALSVSSGNTVIVYDWTCADGGCGTVPSAATGAAGSANLGACTRVAPASIANATANAGQDVWYCPVTGSGSTQVTVTWPSSSYFYNTVIIAQAYGTVVPDGSISNAASGNSATALVNATGAASQQDFVFSAASAVANPLTYTPGGSPVSIQIQMAVNAFTQYYRATALTAPSAQDGLSASTPWLMSIVPFKTTAQPPLTIVSISPTSCSVTTGSAPALCAAMTVTMNNGSSFSPGGTLAVVSQTLSGGACTHTSDTGDFGFTGLNLNLTNASATPATDYVCVQATK